MGVILGFRPMNPIIIFAILSFRPKNPVIIVVILGLRPKEFSYNWCTTRFQIQESVIIVELLGFRGESLINLGLADRV